MSHTTFRRLLKTCSSVSAVRLIEKALSMMTAELSIRVRNTSIDVSGPNCEGRAFEGCVSPRSSNKRKEGIKGRDVKAHAPIFLVREGTARAS